MKTLTKFEEITVDRHTNTHTETKLKYFDGHGRLSQSEESECMWAHDEYGIARVFERCHQGVTRGMDGGKFKMRLSLYEDEMNEWEIK